MRVSLKAEYEWLKSCVKVRDEYIAKINIRLADLVDAVRWERECCQDIRPLAAWGGLYVRHGEDYVDGVADDLRAIQDAARAAVDALVGEG